MAEPPRLRPVGDTGLLVEFGTVIDPAVHNRVLAFDAALAAAPPPGLREAVPAYAAVLLHYDPLVTDAAALGQAALAVAAASGSAAPAGADHVVPMCHAGDFAPDLAEAAARAGLAPEAFIAAHLGAEYRVYMYGFAPGYAYMDGVPAALHLPRKPVPVRSRPVGSVMIAGGQCIITTLPMPTGWWVIGRTNVAVLRPEAPQPFLFAPGDRVRFTSIDAGAFGAGA